MRKLVALAVCAFGCFTLPAQAHLNVQHEQAVRGSIIIDDDYSLVGSTNLDPRSLRLNFELGVEVFESALNQELARHFEQNLAGCQKFTTEELKRRKTLARLRDSSAALFTPYL